MQEKYLKMREKLYHVLVDLEKAFDPVPRKAREWALRRQKIPLRLVKVVVCLYVGSKSRVCITGETSEFFDINVGFHQGSTLNLLLFVLGDMLSCEGGAEKAVTVRTAAAWKKWRELSCLITNRHVPLQSREAIHSACIRSVLLYGSET